MTQSNNNSLSQSPNLRIFNAENKEFHNMLEIIEDG